MLHLTLTTNHARHSPRSEVGDDIIAKLAPTVVSLGGEIPGPGTGRYTVRIEPTPALPDCLLRIDDSAGWRVLDCGLAVHGPALVWAAITSPGDAGMPAELPWLAVIVHARLPPDDARWLADYERCLAWAIIEESRRESRAAVARALGAKGGRATGARKRRSPEHYAEMARRSAEARRAKKGS